MSFQSDSRLSSFFTGVRVRICQSVRAPHAGCDGIITSVDEDDTRGPYLVRFEDGTQFRYRPHEIESVLAPPRQHKGSQLIGRIMKTHFQIFTVFIAVALLSACGPAPNPKLSATPEKAAPEAAAPVVKEEPPPAPAPVVQPEAPVVSRPKSSTRVNREPVRTPAAAKPVSVAARPAPAEDRTEDGPRTLNLPAPITPPIAEPVPPAPQIQPEPVAVAPVIRRMRVPSGTILAVRMTDSVDSETANVGETFKATLDAPVVVNDETVFPEGVDVFVKLSKVQSAGRVSGRSELQLELDRIFLGSESYSLESSKYVSTGSSQAGRTAKTAGLGAAIGAAIGAISGGGKGAIIGGATGAGAGAGVEAIRKGEQVRVESETRLEFRLEDAVEVTLESPSHTLPQRNYPSGPRLGTRR